MKWEHVRQHDWALYTGERLTGSAGWIERLPSGMYAGVAMGVEGLMESPSLGECMRLVEIAYLLNGGSD